MIYFTCLDGEGNVEARSSAVCYNGCESRVSRDLTFGKF